VELPNISIPKAVLDYIPMDQIPPLMHPPLVHFAIVLPIIIVLLELANVILKSGATPEVPKGKGVSTLSFLLILVMVVIFVGAYASGSVDGKAAWSELSEVGQSGLKEHKLLGTYLVFASLALLVFKLIALISGKIGRIILLVVAIAFAGVALKQGKEGGELVYTHGANVKALKDCSDKAFDLQDEIEDLKENVSDLKNVKVPAKAETKAQAQAQIEEVASKEKFEAKVKSAEFQKEAKTDVESTPPATEVKEAEAKVEEATHQEAVEAKEKSEKFQAEAKSDAKVETLPVAE